jgi:hypothetical protein
MATFTLLQMTQNILSALGSDEINSIADTPESLQVAQTIQNKYYDIAYRGDLPEHDLIYQLVPSGNFTIPTLMTLPSHASKLEWLKYFDTSIGQTLQQDQFGSFSHDLNLDIEITTNWTTTSTTTNSLTLGVKTFTVTSNTLPVTIGQGVSMTSGTATMFGNVTNYSGFTMTINVYQISGSGTFSSWTLVSTLNNSQAGYKYVTIIPINQFFDMVNSFNPADSDVFEYQFTESGNKYTLYYKNDSTPQYCTVLSNFYVLFDSFDATQDSTLQASKTLAFGQTVPAFQFTDNFIPQMNDQSFSLLINEAKILAFYELKQMPHPIADAEVKRQWAVVQKEKAVSNKPMPFDQFPYMGRK